MHLGSFDVDTARAELHRLITEEPDGGIDVSDRVPELIVLAAALCTCIEAYLDQPLIAVRCVKLIVERIYRLGYRDGEANERTRVLLGAKEGNDDDA